MELKGPSELVIESTVAMANAGGAIVYCETELKLK
jgi:hypothetical protein